MSKFLGSIHYWLYGKIGHQETLARCLAEAAFKDSRLTNISSYVRNLPPLEAVIDEGNIHGWLQSRIADAKQRYAALVLALTTQEPDYLDILIRGGIYLWYTACAARRDDAGGSVQSV